MENALFPLARTNFLKKLIDLDNDQIDCTLVDLDDIGDAIEAASGDAVSPINLQITGHGYTTGHKILAVGALGNTAIDGIHTITVVDVDNITLDGTTGVGAYTSGGIVVNLDTIQYYSDIPAGARLATQTLANQVVLNDGVFDADDVTFPGVSGDQAEAVLLWFNTTVEATSVLIAIMADATGLPITPTGSDIKITWSNGANRIFKV